MYILSCLNIEYGNFKSLEGGMVECDISKMKFSKCNWPHECHWVLSAVC